MYITIKSFKKTKTVLFYTVYVNVISTFLRGIVFKNI